MRSTMSTCFPFIRPKKYFAFGAPNEILNQSPIRIPCCVLGRIWFWRTSFGSDKENWSQSNFKDQLLWRKWLWNNIFISKRVLCYEFHTKPRGCCFVMNAYVRNSQTAILCFVFIRAVFTSNLPLWIWFNLI